jgi:hypothetical protein
MCWRNTLYIVFTVLRCVSLHVHQPPSIWGTECTFIDAFFHKMNYILKHVCTSMRFWDFHGGENVDCSLLGCVFYPEDGDDTFLWNVGNHIQDYTALQPKTPQSTLLHPHSLSLYASMFRGWLHAERPCGATVLNERFTSEQRRAL